MAGDALSEKLARLVAEEILRTLYGDDLTGCPAGLDQIASIVHQAMEQKSAQDQKIIDVYETLVASLHQVSTPPDRAKVAGADLLSILGQRLDAIHAITTKTLEASQRMKAEQAAQDP